MSQGKGPDIGHFVNIKRNAQHKFKVLTLKEHSTFFGNRLIFQVPKS